MIRSAVSVMSFYSRFISVGEEYKERLELADIRTSVETLLKKNIDERTWQQALTILIEMELIEIRPWMLSSTTTNRSRSIYNSTK